MSFPFKLTLNSNAKISSVICRLARTIKLIMPSYCLRTSLLYYEIIDFIQFIKKVDTKALSLSVESANNSAVYALCVPVQDLVSAPAFFIMTALHIFFFIYLSIWLLNTYFFVRITLHIARQCAWLVSRMKGSVGWTSTHAQTGMFTIKLYSYATLSSVHWPIIWEIV